MRNRKQNYQRKQPMYLVNTRIPFKTLRVVKADGNVGGYAFGENTKKNMLLNEGIETHGNRILNFEKKLKEKFFL